MYAFIKVDLVPTSVTFKWIRVLSKERSTIADHSNLSIRPNSVDASPQTSLQAS